MITRLLQSPALRSAIGFGLGGVGFAVANVLLARALSPADFGVVTLVLSLAQFGLTLGPFGLEIVANRHRPRPTGALALLAFALALVTGLALALVAWHYYGLGVALGFIVMGTVVGTATNRVASAFFQGEGQLRAGLLLIQIHNHVLLAIAIAALFLPSPGATSVLMASMAAYLLSAAIGWMLAMRRLGPGRGEIDLRLALREGVASMGLGVAVQLLMQFERLAIPKLGTLEMLSTFAVLAAVAGSPFRMLQMGTGFSLLPRLRAAPSLHAARQVLRREAAVALAVAVPAAAGVAVVAPFVFDHLLDGKYSIPTQLLLLSIVVGIVKMWEGFSSTVVSACGSARDLALISSLAWVALGLALVASIALAPLGLLGIMAAVGLAWAALAAGGTLLARRALKQRFAVG